jgi:hypothetical protein
MTSLNERPNYPVIVGRNLQGKKLACKESDWKLPGTSSPVKTRTRGNRNGRPNLNARKKQFIEPMSSSGSSSGEDEYDSDLVDSDDEFYEELLLVEDELLEEANSVKPLALCG